MPSRAWAKAFVNPRNSSYGLAWGVLVLAILVVIFLSMELWLDVAITATFLGICVFFLRYPRIPPDLMKELEDEENRE